MAYRGGEEEEEEDMSTLHRLMILHAPTISKRMSPSLFESINCRFHQIFEKFTNITSVQYAYDNALLIFPDDEHCNVNMLRSCNQEESPVWDHGHGCTNPLTPTEGLALNLSP